MPPVGSSSVSKDAYRSLVALHNATQIADIWRMKLSGLDREDDLFRLAGIALVKVDPTVDTLIRAFLSFGRTRTDEPERRRRWAFRVAMLRCPTRFG